MKYVRTKPFFLLCLLLFAACWGKPTFAQTACSLNWPPADAAVSGNHGEYVFIYPRKVAAGYTGCQIMWDELGRKVFVYKFVKGMVREESLTLYSDSGKSESEICKYEGEHLSAISPKDCSAYEDIKDGLN